MLRHKLALAALAIAAISSSTFAVTVDGTLDGSYGSPLTVQSTPTGFGNSTIGSVQFANGSELDAGYATISAGRLYILCTGNLESNFNKLDIFIDSAAGGMGTLSPLVPTDQGSFNRMAANGAAQGLTFDTAFTANRWISVTGGGANPDLFMDYANLDTLVGNYAGQSTPTNGTLSGGSGPVLEATWNNSNTGGVDSASAPNNAATVSTGVEVSIALADIGYTGGNIRISAFINGSGQDFLSNQVLGGLPSGTANLGEPRNVDFRQYAGDQYFTLVVPEPTTLGLIAGAAILGLRRRK